MLPARSSTVTPPSGIDPMHSPGQLESFIQTVLPPNSSSDPANEEGWSDADETMDSLGPPGSPSITSRLSVQKVCTVISQFSDFKRELVKEIGFGGALHTQPWQKLNLKLSAWLMDRVDLESSCLNIEGQVPVGIFDQDVQKVLDLPCGKCSIGPEGVDPSEACIEYTRFAATLSDKGTHSLKAAETYLLRDINPDSPALEVECFKIAFVIFYVGHILAPSAKHDYISIDFWSAINDTSKFREYNWCGYVLKHLFAAVRKFKSDVSKRNSTIHLVGNHLFLQLKFIDLLDLGALARPANVLPRIGLYDYESMKKIIEFISVNLGGDTSFHGANFTNRDTTVRNPDVNQSTNQSVVNVVQVPLSANILNGSNRKPAAVPSTPMLRAAYGKTGPLEFAAHIRNRYPTIAAEKLGNIFKEQNARQLSNVAELRQTQQAGMFTFVDKVMACIVENCTCCKAAGRRQCILKVPPTNTGTDRNTHLQTAAYELDSGNVFRTPVPDKTMSHVSGHSECDESSSAQSTVNRKRDSSSIAAVSSVSSKQRRFHVDQPQFDTCLHAAERTPAVQSGMKPATPLAAKIITFLDDVAASIVTMQAEFRPGAEYLIFGQTTDLIPVRTAIQACGFARAPWAVGSCPLGPSHTVTEAIQGWMARASENVLQKKWIIHPKPRLVLVDGISIRDQFVGNTQMSHEMNAVVMRRYAQIDKINSKDAAGMCWRKFMGPDFATTVLCNADPMIMQTVRDELIPDPSDYKIQSCRMWYITTVLEEGWVVYLFDMLHKRIQVLDPAVGPFGFSTPRVKIHEYITSKLHGALFHCINKFYSNWVCTKEKWSRSFPIIMSEKFTREESGLCATFFVKHYDGEKLLMPLNQENLNRHKQNTLYDILRLEGNHSAIPSDALEAIKSSFIVM